MSAAGRQCAPRSAQLRTNVYPGTRLRDPKGLIIWWLRRLPEQRAKVPGCQEPVFWHTLASPLAPAGNQARSDTAGAKVFGKARIPIKAKLLSLIGIPRTHLFIRGVEACFFSEIFLKILDARATAPTMPGIPEERPCSGSHLTICHKRNSAHRLGGEKKTSVRCVRVPGKGSGVAWQTFPPDGSPMNLLTLKSWFFLFNLMGKDFL